MRLQHPLGKKPANSAFTLVEMIGVLAIIAILASLLIPRVFQAIGDSKISNAASTCNSIKAAVNEYYGKYGLIAGAKGVTLNLPNDGDLFEDWDLKVLVAEGFAEKPFSVRIGNGNIGATASPAGSRLRVINISGNSTNSAPATLGDGAYNLDGASTTNDISGMLLVEAVIIDGAVLGATNVNASDMIGRVKYPAHTNGKTDVHVYMAHR